MEVKYPKKQKKVPFACLLLAVFIFIFVLLNADVLKLKYKEITINHQQPPPAPKRRPPPFCSIQPLSSADALEERSILDSIAWPQTPSWPGLLPLKDTTDPAHSSFTILPGKREGGQWQVGDQLEVTINMFDFQGQPKRTGGDVVIARLHNKTLGAGVVGQVLDLLNGSYSAAFPLLWEGSAQVEVTLVHSSEAVTVLRGLNKQQPDRLFFKGLFRSGSVSETTTCNICLHETGQLLCNLTDMRTGEPWFCYKPKNLSCDTRTNHLNGGLKENLKPTEEKLFQKNVNMKVFLKASGPAGINVLPSSKDQPEVETSSKKSGVSGYYYSDVWRALSGNKVTQFDTSSAVNECLNGKMVHLYGDSTIRQWFEYLNALLSDAKQLNLQSPKQVGPFMLLGNANRFFITYRCHGPPISFRNVPVSQLHYIANEIDGEPGGSHTIIAISIWAHFNSFPMELYIRRLQNIRRAVVRLLSRAPDTVVIIRTPNPREMSLRIALTNSDWYSFQQDRVVRAVFKGLKVHLVDAWEMTTAHHLPHAIHPYRPIVKNMVNVLLSYVCPKKGS